MNEGNLLPLHHLKAGWIPLKTCNCLAAHIWVPQDTEAKDVFAGRLGGATITGGKLDLDEQLCLKNCA